MDLRESLIVIAFFYIFALLIYNPMYALTAYIGYIIGVFTGLVELDKALAD